MKSGSDVTESLVDRTKRLLEQRDGLTLREVATKAGVGHEWLKSFACGRADNPGIQTLEKLYNFLVEYHAAKRFEKRIESRAS